MDTHKEMWLVIECVGIHHWSSPRYMVLSLEQERTGVIEILHHELCSVYVKFDNSTNTYQQSIENTQREFEPNISWHTFSSSLMTKNCYSTTVFNHTLQLKSAKVT